jgi:5-formyltetrahydrofolate cyclo-ligase
MTGSKAELRRAYLAKRESLSDADRAEASSRIAESLSRAFDLDTVGMLHIFLSMTAAGEVDTSFIIRRVRRDHLRTAIVVPRIDRPSGNLESVEFTADTELYVNRWGIREPIGGRIVPPGEVDLVVVPLLCFDLRGHRVGYGKGYYDRFLAKCRPTVRKAGVSFFDPVDEISDIHAGDIALDLVITARRVWTFQ